MIGVKQTQGRINDCPIAGTATKITGQRIDDILSYKVLPRLVKREEGHDNARCTESALRRMSLNQCLLYRMELTIGRFQVFYREKRQAIQLR